MLLVCGRLHDKREDTYSKWSSTKQPRSLSVLLQKDPRAMADAWDFDDDAFSDETDDDGVYNNERDGGQDPGSSASGDRGWNDSGLDDLSDDDNDLSGGGGDENLEDEGNDDNARTGDGAAGTSTSVDPPLGTSSTDEAAAPNAADSTVSAAPAPASPAVRLMAFFATPAEGGNEAEGSGNGEADEGGWDDGSDGFDFNSLSSDDDGDGAEEDPTRGVESTSLVAAESEDEAESESSPLSPYVDVDADVDADDGGWDDPDLDLGLGNSDSDDEGENGGTRGTVGEEAVALDAATPEDEDEDEDDDNIRRNGDVDDNDEVGSGEGWDDEDLDINLEEDEDARGASALPATADEGEGEATAISPPPPQSPAGAASTLLDLGFVPPIRVHHPLSSADISYDPEEAAGSGTPKPGPDTHPVSEEYEFGPSSQNAVVSLGAEYGELRDVLQLGDRPLGDSVRLHECRVEDEELRLEEIEGGGTREMEAEAVGLPLSSIGTPVAGTTPVRTPPRACSPVYTSPRSASPVLRPSAPPHTEAAGTMEAIKTGIATQSGSGAETSMATVVATGTSCGGEITPRWTDIESDLDSSSTGGSDSSNGRRDGWDNDVNVDVDVDMDVDVDYAADSRANTLSQDVDTTPLAQPDLCSLSLYGTSPLGLPLSETGTPTPIARVTSGFSSWPVALGGMLPPPRVAGAGGDDGSVDDYTGGGSDADDEDECEGEGWDDDLNLGIEIGAEEEGHDDDEAPPSTQLNRPHPLAPSTPTVAQPDLAGIAGLAGGGGDDAGVETTGADRVVVDSGGGTGILLSDVEVRDDGGATAAEGRLMLPLPPPLTAEGRSGRAPLSPSPSVCQDQPPLLTRPPLAASFAATVAVAEASSSGNNYAESMKAERASEAGGSDGGSMLDLADFALGASAEEGESEGFSGEATAVAASEPLPPLPPTSTNDPLAGPGDAEEYPESMAAERASDAGWADDEELNLADFATTEKTDDFYSLEGIAIDGTGKTFSGGVIATAALEPLPLDSPTSVPPFTTGPLAGSGDAEEYPESMAAERASDAGWADDEELNLADFATTEKTDDFYSHEGIADDGEIEDSDGGWGKGGGTLVPEGYPESMAAERCSVADLGSENDGSWAADDGDGGLSLDLEDFIAAAEKKMEVAVREAKEAASTPKQKNRPPPAPSLLFPRSPSPLPRSTSFRTPPHPRPLTLAPSPRPPPPLPPRPPSIPAAAPETGEARDFVRECASARANNALIAGSATVGQSLDMAEKSEQEAAVFDNTLGGWEDDTLEYHRYLEKTVFTGCERPPVEDTCRDEDRNADADAGGPSEECPCLEQVLCHPEYVNIGTVIEVMSDGRQVRIDYKKLLQNEIAKRMLQERKANALSRMVDVLEGSLESEKEERKRAEEALLDVEERANRPEEDAARKREIVDTEKSAEILELERDKAKADLLVARESIAMLEDEKNYLARRVGWYEEEMHNLQCTMEVSDLGRSLGRADELEYTLEEARQRKEEGKWARNQAKTTKRKVDDIEGEVMALRKQRDRLIVLKEKLEQSHYKVSISTDKKVRSLAQERDVFRSQCESLWLELEIQGAQLTSDEVEEAKREAQYKEGRILDLEGEVKALMKQRDRLIILKESIEVSALACTHNELNSTDKKVTSFTHERDVFQSQCDDSPQLELEMQSVEKTTGKVQCMQARIIDLEDEVTVLMKQRDRLIVLKESIEISQDSTLACMCDELNSTDKKVRSLTQEKDAFRSQRDSLQLELEMQSAQQRPDEAERAMGEVQYKQSRIFDLEGEVKALTKQRDRLIILKEKMENSQNNVFACTRDELNSVVQQVETIHVNRDGFLSKFKRQEVQRKKNEVDQFKKDGNVLKRELSQILDSRERRVSISAG